MVSGLKTVEVVGTSLAWALLLGWASITTQ